MSSLPHKANERQDDGLPAGQEESPTLREAVRLARLGYAVTPLHPVVDGRCACGNPECQGKHPLREKDQQWSRDPKTVALFYKVHPDAGVAINLKASRLLVIAPDSQAEIEHMESLGLPDSPIAQSGSGIGRHYLYQRPEDAPIHRLCKPLPGTSDVLIDGGDILSDGITVVPPSRNVKGEYVWLTPLDKPVDQLPLAPDWAVTELIRSKERSGESKATIDLNQPPIPLSGEALLRWKGELLEYKPNGDIDRSMSLTRLANALAQAGLSDAGIYRELQERGEALKLAKYDGRGNDDELVKLATTAFERHGLKVNYDALLTGNSGDSYELTTMADFRKRPQPNWLIKGMLREQSTGMVYGEWSTYKTYLCLDMALSIATGLDWQEFENKGSGDVVYIAGEGAYTLVSRYDAWIKHHGTGDVDNFYLLDHAVPMLDSKHVARLIQAIHQRTDAPKVIFLDTLSRNFMPGNENQQEDMNKFVAGMEALKREFGTSVIAVHHKNANGGIRGSTVLPGNIDVVLEFTLKGKSRAVTIETKKQKGAPALAPFIVKAVEIELDYDDPEQTPSDLIFIRHHAVRTLATPGVASEDGKIANVDLSTEPEEPTPSDHRTRILEALADAGDKPLSGRQLQQAIRVTHTDRFKDYLAPLIKDEFVSVEEPARKGAARPHRLTAKGRREAARLGLLLDEEGES